MRFALLLVILSVTACKAPPPTSIRELTLLMRADCPYAPDLAARLEAALTSLHLPSDYQVVDLDTLPETDPRIGYPTPTILLRNRDMFGMPEPTPPFPEPT